jgi:CysZ protein
MQAVDNIYSFFRHFLLGLVKHYEAVEFLWMHKLWKGILKYGWLSRALIFAALFLGVKYFSVLSDWISSTADAPWQASSLMSLGQSSLQFFNENVWSVFDGSRKYIILVLTEVITFHMIRSTFSIVTGQAQDKSFKAFVDAQIRMIKIAAFSWAMELVAGILLGIALGLLNIEFLESTLLFFVACFFLGFALIDNFFEQYELDIKNSYKKSIDIAGAAVALGLIFNGLLYIPLIGAILAPCVGGVAAALLLADLMRKGEVDTAVPEVELVVDAN